jgi:BRCA1-associated protein
MEGTTGVFETVQFDIGCIPKGGKLHIEQLPLPPPRGSMEIFSPSRPPLDTTPSQTLESPFCAKNKERRKKFVRPDGFNGVVFSEDNVLLISLVPSFMAVDDVLSFSPNLRGTVDYFRYLRDPNKCCEMLLLVFKTMSDAEKFWREDNGRPFSSFVVERCRVSLVAAIECDPATISVDLDDRCTVCLDPLSLGIDGEHDGIFTLLCGHSFHTHCLMQWLDISCPVCRFLPPIEDQAECLTCGRKIGLWMCLTCGHVGCGRYEGEHAFQHFVETQHTYAIDMETHATWDYVTDEFVHRTVHEIRFEREAGESGQQNITEGSRDDMTISSMKKNPGIGIREIQDPLRSQYAVELDSLQARYESKMDAVVSDYNFMLTRELESLRRRVEVEMEEDRRRFSMRERQYEDERHRLLHRIQNLEKDMHAKTKTMGQLRREKEFAEHLNESLTKSVDEWKRKAEKETSVGAGKQKRIDDLSEQVQDLMFYLNAKDTLESSGIAGDEIREGRVVLDERDDGMGGEEEGISSRDPHRRKAETQRRLRRKLAAKNRSKK